MAKKKCCTSCGLCFQSMNTIEKNGQTIPISQKSGREFDLSLCPGIGYNLSGPLKQKSFHSDYLGGWESIHAVRSNNPLILKNAASGGIMTAIALKALEIGLADKVIATRLVCKDGKIQAETFATSDPEELFQAQGSKYMPVSALAHLMEMIEHDKKYVYIGTPCQIAGIRLLQKKNELIRNAIVLTVGNFCGGYRDLRERESIFRQLHIKESDVIEFAYRRGTQPGYMLIRLNSGKEYHLPYPAYAKMTGFSPMRRCRLCMDATAELADFSCGDAWIDRFRKTDNAWSILISRSSASEKILSALKEDHFLSWGSITEDEIFSAQKGNITSKKIRQPQRRAVYSMLGNPLPDFGVSSSKVATKEQIFEIKVLFSHFCFSALQHLGLYPVYSRITHRNKCKIEVMDVKQ